MMPAWFGRLGRAAVLAATMAAPAMAQQAATPESLRARGAYLAEGIAACGNCHTPKGQQGELPGMTLAGGFVIDIPGTFRAVVPNITPDPETGIGRWTDAEIARAIREGRRPDGSVIGPPMPIELYRRIGDEDLAALVAYVRSVPAVRNRVERSTYAIPLPPDYGPPVGRVQGPPADDPVARGAYLAGPLGHCSECHTPMTGGQGMQRDWSRTGAGGVPIPSPFGMVVPRNITPASLRDWTDAEIGRAITQGISRDGRRLMPPMAFPYYARISPGDLADIIAWIRSLPPQP